MSLSISTAWNAFRYSNAEQMILELKELGFKEVELSFNLTEEMVKAVENFWVSIVKLPPKIEK